jgi:hypothetical protein
MILIEAKNRLNDDAGASWFTIYFAKIIEIVVQWNFSWKKKRIVPRNRVEWFDAKRLRRGITRTGNQRVKGAASLTADDKRFFLKIPQAEIDANDLIESVNADR